MESHRINLPFLRRWTRGFSAALRVDFSLGILSAVELDRVALAMIAVAKKIHKAKRECEREDCLRRSKQLQREREKEGERAVLGRVHRHSRRAQSTTSSACATGKNQELTSKID
jgi:hypothetical protein